MQTTAPLQGAATLSHLGLIRARGAEAASFLQGQLTSDVAGLDERSGGLAGYCSAKGRLLASFTVWRSGPEEFLLACSADLLAPTLKRLSMFVMRAKCKLDDASAAYRLVGIAGPLPSTIPGMAVDVPIAAADGNAAATAAADADADADAEAGGGGGGNAGAEAGGAGGAGAIDSAGAGAGAGTGPEAPALAVWQQAALGEARVLRLPDAAGVTRYLWIAPTDVSPPALAELPLADWRWLEVQSGVPLIEQATVEQFVPQMVNLELVGGVSFSKGCYPGQEIVARSQYRGTLKRRMALFDVAVPAQAGQEIFHSGDATQPAGMVVNAAAAPEGGSSALIEVKLAALGDGSLHLAGAEGPLLQPRALPYAWQSDAAA